MTELDPVVGCEAPVNALPSQQRAPVHKPFTQSRLPPEEPAHPAPRQISEEELSVLESCLQRWRNEVEGDIRGMTPNPNQTLRPVLGGKKMVDCIITIGFVNIARYIR